MYTYTFLLLKKILLLYLNQVKVSNNYKNTTIFNIMSSQSDEVFYKSVLFSVSK